MGLSMKGSNITVPFVLQAKKEVAELREVIDGWHQHCQVG